METKITLDNIIQMVAECMDTTFVINNKEYNLNKLGWSFSFSQRKRALGTCRKSNKTIYLSKWIILNSNNNLEAWRNTMLHEIAHAIDIEIRGISNHDSHWQSIAIAVGSDGQRCAHVDYKGNVKSKYTIKCNNCNNERPAHRRRKKIVEGRVSCGRCSGSTFNKKYVLELIQNY